MFDITNNAYFQAHPAAKTLFDIGRAVADYYGYPTDRAIRVINKVGTGIQKAKSLLDSIPKSYTTSWFSYRIPTYSVSAPGATTTRSKLDNFDPVEDHTGGYTIKTSFASTTHTTPQRRKLLSPETWFGGSYVPAHYKYINFTPGMAKKRKTSTKKTKKSWKRKSNYIPRMVPYERFGILRWVSDDASYSPAATTGGIDLSMNDLYDPHYTSGAQRIQYYTELAAIYARYKVYSCKWAIHMSNTTSDQVQGAYCYSIAAEIPPTTAAGLTETIQKGHPIWIGATDENLSNHIELGGVWSLKKVAKHVDEDEGYSGAINGSPSKNFLLHFTFGSASNINLKYRCVFEFTVLMYEMQQIAPV